MRYTLHQYAMHFTGIEGRKGDGMPYVITKFGRMSLSGRVARTTSQLIDSQNTIVLSDFTPS